LFNNNYNAEDPRVIAMAQLIANDGNQTFETTDDFSQKYGTEAVKMITEGGLLSALYKIGFNAIPKEFHGNQPKGLIIKKLHIETN